MLNVVRAHGSGPSSSKRPLKHRADLDRQRRQGQQHQGEPSCKRRDATHRDRSRSSPNLKILISSKAFQMKISHFMRLIVHGIQRKHL